MTTNPIITHLLEYSEANTQNHKSFTARASKLIKQGWITDEELMRHITGERKDLRLHTDLTQDELIYYEGHIDKLI